MSESMHLAGLQQYFLSIRDDSSYLLRSKIYKNTSFGLSETHEKLTSIDLKLQEIEASKPKLLNDTLMGIRNEIEETLVLMTQYEIFNLEFEDLKKYSILINSLVEDLADLVDRMEKGEAVEIPNASNDEDSKAIISYRYQDLIDQILKSFTWKEFEAEMIATEDEDQFDRFVRLLSLINECKVKGSLLESYEFLDQISKLALHMRERVAIDITNLYKLVPLLFTLIKIYDSDIAESEKTAFSQDLEYIINSGQLSWLSLLHEKTEEEVPPDLRHHLPKRFMERMKISRNPVDQFQWTMNSIMDYQTNPIAIELTSKIAQLSTMLLTTATVMEELGFNAYYEEIQLLQVVNYQDAISDISEIYNPQAIDITHLTTALEKKLAEMKAILLDIITFQQVAEEVILMLERDPHVSQPVTHQNLSEIIASY